MNRTYTIKNAPKIGGVFFIVYGFLFGNQSLAHR